MDCICAFFKAPKLLHYIDFTLFNSFIFVSEQQNIPDSLDCGGAYKNNYRHFSYDLSYNSSNGKYDNSLLLVRALILARKTPPPYLICTILLL